MRNCILLIIILFSLWLLSSCGGAAPVEEPSMPAAEEPAEAPPKRIDELYVLESAVWESNVIHVCWENPEQNNEAEREFIRTAIENTWEAVSLVDFIGWDACFPESTGIRVQLRDESPHTVALGAQLDSMENGMVLNTIFDRWGCVDAAFEQAPCIFPYNGYSREDLIRTIAVHEFGHALGFAHEQNRDDTPSWCDTPQGTEGTMPIGGWDQDSVMNYCNPEWLGNGYLSVMDIEGVQMIYGAKIIGKDSRKSDLQFR